MSGNLCVLYGTRAGVLFTLTVFIVIESATHAFSHINKLLTWCVCVCFCVERAWAPHMLALGFWGGMWWAGWGVVGCRLHLCAPRLLGRTRTCTRAAVLCWRGVLFVVGVSVIFHHRADQYLSTRRVKRSVRAQRQLHENSRVRNTPPPPHREWEHTHSQRHAIVLIRTLNAVCPSAWVACNCCRLVFFAAVGGNHDQHAKSVRNSEGVCVGISESGEGSY